MPKKKPVTRVYSYMDNPKPFIAHLKEEAKRDEDLEGAVKWALS
jgi:hypothetical protein